MRRSAEAGWRSTISAAGGAGAVFLDAVADGAGAVFLDAVADGAVRGHVGHADRNRGWFRRGRGENGGNLIQFRNLSSGREWAGTVVAPWYHTPEWPEDPNPGGVYDQAISAMLKRWEAGQEMLKGLLTVDDGLFLARYQNKAEDGTRLYSYIVADTTGTTWISTGRSPIRLMDMAPGKAYGVEADTDDGSTVLYEYTIARELFD